MSSAISAELRARFVDNGQGHIFTYVDSGAVPDDAARAFAAQLNAIDVPLVNELFSATMAAAATPEVAASLSPCRNVTVLSSTPAGVVSSWRDRALRAVAAGQLAALILAGGQGTRLGFDRPKGEYDIGLPSGRSLFALMAARVQRLRELARELDGAGADAPLPSLPIYVMTSPMTDKDTREFWTAQAFFGLPEADVRFFSQGTLPCLSLAGKIILESGGAVAEAPDGNGGIYRAMHLSGVVADMRARGVVGVHVFAVDNAIVRIADPVFLGFCLERDADVGSKVCPKAGPHEKVGVLCEVGGVHRVVEYSEMDKASAELRNADGSLSFNAGNICIHYFSRAFLEGPCSPEQLPKVYHLAKKVRFMRGGARFGVRENGGQRLPPITPLPHPSLPPNAAAAYSSSNPSPQSTPVDCVRGPRRQNYGQGRHGCEVWRRWHQRYQTRVIHIRRVPSSSANGRPRNREGTGVLPRQKRTRLCGRLTRHGTRAPEHAPQGLALRSRRDCHRGWSC